MLIDLGNGLKRFLPTGGKHRPLKALNAVFNGSCSLFWCKMCSLRSLMPFNEEQKQEIPETSGSPFVRFCTLEYRGRQWDGATPTVLLVLEEAKGNLRFLVHPDWQSIVEPQDLKYMESLLRDFVERARVKPASLFKQLHSLGVGPLVTRETGERASDHPQLLQLCSLFVQL